MSKEEYYFREGCFITELHNTPDDPDVSVARARVEPGTTTKWHYLKNTDEKYVIIKGIGIAERSDKPAERLVAGDVLDIRAGERQRITNVGEEQLVFLAICSPRFQPENYVEE